MNKVCKYFNLRYINNINSKNKSKIFRDKSKIIRDKSNILINDEMRNVNRLFNYSYKDEIKYREIEKILKRKNYSSSITDLSIIKKILN